MLKNIFLTYTLVAILMTVFATTVAAQKTSSLDIKFAGALEFTEDGTLFVGDNYNGAVYAFKVPSKTFTGKVFPSSIANIDTKISELLGVGVGAVAINDMATHPTSQELYISVTRIGNFASHPAIVKVSQDQSISLLDLSSLEFQKQELKEFPNDDETFKVRGAGPFPPLARDVAKDAVSLRSLAIMDMEYYKRRVICCWGSTGQLLIFPTSNFLSL